MFTIRSAGTGTRYLEGYVCKFGDVVKFQGKPETVRQGAFRKLIDSGQEVACVYHHASGFRYGDNGAILGRRSAGTLKLTEDNIGLWVEVALPKTQYADEVWELVNRGDVKGGSYNFLEHSVIREQNGMNVFDEMYIDEVTVTPFPVNPNTTMKATQRAFGSEPAQNEQVLNSRRTRMNRLRARLALMEA